MQIIIRDPELRVVVSGRLHFLHDELVNAHVVVCPAHLERLGQKISQREPGVRVVDKESVVAPELRRMDVSGDCNGDT